MGRGGLNIWHKYSLFCGSTQWLLVQPDTYTMLKAALQNKLLNNKMHCYSEVCIEYCPY